MAKRSKGANLSGKIVTILKERIIKWKYAPDFPLTEENLSREFRVSRSPVREALSILEASGLVRRMPNRGYQVKQVKLADVKELYALRLALELFVVEHLAVNQSCHQAIRELILAWQGIDLATMESTALAKLDQDFHEGLAAILGNNILLQHLASINERLFIFRMIDFDRAGRTESTRLQHLAILESILEGDAPKAREAINRNVDDARKNVDWAIRDALAMAYGMDFAT